ncbi:MAG: hypothetical protein EOO01_06820 [Chitinophagaceae bacterium]|nr:MAG: hypothetical protein EOO01_06820 [Chitinophagaceae bacterium]
MDTNNNDPKNKTWNNEQDESNVNEGFSGNNIPEGYNPKKDLSETETTSDGSKKTVDRARNAEQDAGNENKPGLSSENPDSQAVKTREDHNYDDPNRYDDSNPESRKKRSENP